MVKEIERDLESQGRVSSSWRRVATGAEGILALPSGMGLPRLIELLDLATRAPVGVSAVFSLLEHAVVAARQARLALRSCTPGAAEVRSYPGNLLPALLITSPREAAEAASVLAPLTDDRHGAAGQTLQVLEAWVHSDGTMAHLAETLSMHRNTVRSHLDRVQRETGLDLRIPADAAVACVAVEAHRLHRSEAAAGPSRRA